MDGLFAAVRPVRSLFPVARFVGGFAVKRLQIGVAEIRDDGCPATFFDGIRVVAEVRDDRRDAAFLFIRVGRVGLFFVEIFVRFLVQHGAGIRVRRVFDGGHGPVFLMVKKRFDGQSLAAGPLVSLHDFGEELHDSHLRCIPLWLTTFAVVAALNAFSGNLINSINAVLLESN